MRSGFYLTVVVALTVLPVGLRVCPSLSSPAGVVDSVAGVCLAAEGGLALLVGCDSYFTRGSGFMMAYTADI